MKIWIEKANADPSNVGGKALFQRRLADEFRRCGYEVVDNGAADISLNNIRIKHTRSRKTVLRLDGVWHDTGKQWKQKNRGMAEAVKQADGVVFQSKFAQQMGHKYLGRPQGPEVVIHNGSDPRLWDAIPPAVIDCKHLFMAVSKWRPHKRLRDIIESFILAEIPDSKLFVCGDGAKSGIPKEEAEAYFARPDIEYLGNVLQPILMSLMKAATASIHLCWFDACPNSVVEAICAGVPVITNNVGGTPEIVSKANGYVRPLDKLYDFTPVDLYNPPSIDREMVVSAMRATALHKGCIPLYKDHVDIRNVAQSYLAFFGRLLV